MRNNQQPKESNMDKATARVCFELLMKQQKNKPDWKQAVSWSYHHEPIEEVVDNFNLTTESMLSVQRAVEILEAVKADYDTVHAWSVHGLTN